MSNWNMLIVYMGNGDFTRLVAKEAMVERVIKEMKYEGNQVVSHEVKDRYQKLEFSDGSKLHVSPSYQIDKTQKYTHIYMDDMVRKSINHTNAISDLLEKESGVLDGLMTYQLENSKIKIEKL